MTKVFDSHAHLDARQYDKDRAQIIKDCMENLAGVINPGCDCKTTQFAINLAKEHEHIYAGVGFHPHNAKEMTEKDIEAMAEWAKYEKVVAVGEIGLDYHYDHSPRDVQKKAFIRQLDLARELDLPVIIHDREAHGDILKTIQQEGKGTRGVFHCYSGSWEMAKEVLKCNYMVAFGGSLTFSNAVKTVEVAKNVPLDMVLLETDSPYLTPMPFRGQRNTPTLIKYVCEKLANERKMEFNEIADITTNNVYKLFSKIGNK